MPLTMPMFTNTLVKSMSVTAPDSSRENIVEALAVMTIARPMMRM